MIAGYDEQRTNYAYCPPGAEYRTIEAYVYPAYCPKGPSGKFRKAAPYFSNPKVTFNWFATGSEKANNAALMTKERLNSAKKGSNCLDGNPTKAWMEMSSNGNNGIGSNCRNGENSYDPPITEDGEFLISLR